MEASDPLRERARATWSAGNWDGFSRFVKPVGALVIARAGVEPGADVLDVGTGSGGNVAIPAAQLGANVVGVDVTPELFTHARRRAAEAGVEVQWIEADAQALPFRDASFDRVISTFGAMFAPDHKRAAGEVVRVCRPGGRIAMATWANDGFVAEMFKLTASFLPPAPAGVQPPGLWGVEAHVRELLGAAGVDPAIVRETVEFRFSSVEHAVQQYADDFGPFVTARATLEPQGRWQDFLDQFGDLVRRFDLARDTTTTIASDYFVITADR